eukprot:TRINITY_DN94951_c0_g1_i1.p1 TRINITY_DN94951_c0_g1~~TRINITY_DN94951_c0_g1_i1.p1  ORF type:complete len:165 (+),score=40.15 TRINITY_DN94951_c0_g1_i1:77-571(+)
MPTSRKSPRSLDYNLGVLNFGDEQLYLSVLAEYSQQLPSFVKRVEEKHATGDRAGLREEVLLIQGSAAYISADALRSAAEAFVTAFDDDQGNESGLISALGNQAKVLCSEIQRILSGGAKGVTADRIGRARDRDALEADELMPVLEGSGAGETPARKCSGCALQ